MNRRRIKLEDGRYLIFYTFDDEGGAGGSDAAERKRDEAPRRAPEAEPVAEEERSV